MNDKGLPAPTTVRLEYLTPSGKWELLAVHELLYPERYPGRLSEAGKVARAVEVGGRRRVWSPENIPVDPSVLVRSTEGGPTPWRLPRPEDACCEHCTKVHPPPHDGGCLL